MTFAAHFFCGLENALRRPVQFTQIQVMDSDDICMLLIGEDSIIRDYVSL